LREGILVAVAHSCKNLLVVKFTVGLENCEGAMTLVGTGDCAFEKLHELY
jgi:hypothetical protein